MILILNICKEKLHYFEFVKPVEDILNGVGGEFTTVNICDLNLDLNFDKIIICGTSLKDNSYLDIDLSLIKSTTVPVLGICGGFQKICLEFGATLQKETEIGFYKENFTKEFLGLTEEQEVYHLHNNYVTLPDEFESFTDSKITQAVKHKAKEIYGTLFHPEVRNKNLILEFVKKC